MQADPYTCIAKLMPKSGKRLVSVGVGQVAEQNVVDLEKFYWKLDVLLA